MRLTADIVLVIILSININDGLSQKNLSCIVVCFVICREQKAI